jgi:hypothetical protein
MAILWVSYLDKNDHKITANGRNTCRSHNATVSAWGKFTIARDSKQPKVNIRYDVVLKLYSFILLLT